MKKYIYISLLFLTCLIASAFSSKIKPVFGVRVIVIDAGHGGKDPGCHGSKYNEKDIALAVALKLGKYIEDNMKDVKVIYTRNTDVFVELQERAEIANRAKADLFISIHCNSACVRGKPHKPDVRRDQVNGAETYVMGIKNEKGKLDIAKRENSAILLEDNFVKKYDGFNPNSDESYIIMSMFADTYLNQSLNFASKTQKQYGAQARVDKGVKRASLWVLWRTYMPSVLTEIGYLSNREEESFLGSEKGQDEIASSIFKSLRDYKDDIEGAPKKHSDVDIIHQNPPKETNINNGEKQESDIAVKQDSLVPSTIKKEEQKSLAEVPKKAVDEKKTPVSVIKNDNTKVIEPIKSVIVYKVQLLSSDKKIPLNSGKFKNVETPGEYMDKGVYKYTGGEFSDIQKAKQLQTKLRKNGFKDAFVIAIQDGKRITLK